MAVSGPPPAVVLCLDQGQVCLGEVQALRAVARRPVDVHVQRAAVWATDQLGRVDVDLAAWQEVYSGHVVNTVSGVNGLGPGSTRS